MDQSNPSIPEVAVSLGLRRNPFLALREGLHHSGMSWDILSDGPCMCLYCYMVNWPKGDWVWGTFVALEGPWSFVYPKGPSPGLSQSNDSHRARCDSCLLGLHGGSVCSLSVHKIGGVINLLWWVMSDSCWMTSCINFLFCMVWLIFNYPNDCLHSELNQLAGLYTCGVHLGVLWHVWRSDCAHTHTHTYTCYETVAWVSQVCELFCSNNAPIFSFSFFFKAWECYHGCGPWCVQLLMIPLPHSLCLNSMF